MCEKAGGKLKSVTDNNFRQLQIAIVKQAVEDYILALFKLKFETTTTRPHLVEKAKTKAKRRNERRIKEVEEFFLSDWGDQLCECNGETVLKQTRQLGKIAKEIVYKYDRGYFYTTVFENEDITRKFPAVYGKYRIVKGCYALHGVESFLNLLVILKERDYKSTLVDIDENNENK